MPRNISSPSRGIGVAIFIVQMFALLGVTLLWFLVLVPNVFNPLGLNSLWVYSSLALVWVIVYTCLWLIGRSARRVSYEFALMPLIPLTTNSTQTQPVVNQALQVIEYWPVTLLILIGAATFILYGLITAGVVDPDGVKQWLRDEHGWGE